MQNTGARGGTKGVGQLLYLDTDQELVKPEMAMQEECWGSVKALWELKCAHCMNKHQALENQRRLVSRIIEV